MIASVDRLFGDLLGARGASIGVWTASTGGWDRLEYRVSQLEPQVGELASQVAAYHGAVVGHGILICELDERLHRVEQDRDSPA